MIIERDTRQELLEAAAWYEAQGEGLGHELLGVVGDVLARIAEAPRTFPLDQFDPRARRALVQRFPYIVVFVVHQGDLRVIAFAHAKRNPFYWKRRL